MMFFIQNAVGFFIQFLPCTLMIFLPFPQETYRIGKRSLFACLTIFIAVFSVLLPILLQSGISKNTALTANLFTLLVMFITLTAFILLVRESPIKKLLVFFIVLFYGALQYCLVNTLSGFLSVFFHFSPISNGWSVYSLHGVLLYAVTALFMLPCMIPFVSRTLKEYIREVYTRNMRREFFILIFSTCIFIIMMSGFDFAYYYLEYRLYLILLAILLAVIMYQVLIYWLIMRESARQRRESAQLRALELQQLQYEKIAVDMENTRRMHHDLRHHYNTLNDMLDRGELKEMKDYLSKLTDTSAGRVSRTYCRNMVVNSLLQYYTGIAADENIRCEVNAECGELDIEPSDITVLLGNVMENAINSCRKYPKAPIIDIRIGTFGSSLAMEITNSCKEVRLDSRFRSENGFLPSEAFLSSSGDSYGLKSVAHTVQKYEGISRFLFDPQKELFITQIRINMNG